MSLNISKWNLQTDLVSPDALPRPQVIARCDIIYNPLNAELNPTCHLLALLGAHPILHISRIRVNLNSNITITTISHSMPRIRAIDERHNLSKEPKTSQMLLF